MATQTVRDRIRMGDAHNSDQAESFLRSIDNFATTTTGISLFHLMTIFSIVGSVLLFMSGRKMEGIFVGLWPPTFQALKSAAEE